MAEDLGAIKYRIEADTSGLARAEDEMAAFSKTAKAGAKDVDDLGKEIEQTGKRSQKGTEQISSGFENAARSLKQLVGVYVSFQTVKAITTGVAEATMEFSQSIADLSAITGASGKDLEFYANKAKEIGRTTSLSAAEAAEGFKLIASAKPDLLESATALAAVTQEAVTLAEATGISLPESAAALGSALNQFQMPAGDAARVVNALAASAQFGTAEVQQVTEAMRNAGSAANSLGLDFEETVAGIQALAAAGRQGADAGTALRQVLLKLEATGRAELQPSVVGLVGALNELKSQNLDNTELMDLFGQEAFTAATALLAQSDTAEQLNTSLRGTNTATEQAAVRMDTLQGDTLKAQSAIEALQITLGEKAEPAMRAMAQATAGAANAVTAFLTGMSDEDLIESIGMVVDENGNLVDSAEAAAEAARKFQETMTGSGGLSEAATETAGSIAEELSPAVEQFTVDTLKLIDSLESQYKALGMNAREQAMFNAELKALAAGDGPEAIRTVRDLAARNYDAAEAIKEAEAQMAAFGDSLEYYKDQQRKAREEQEKNERSILETIAALENETLSLQMTGRAQAVFNAVTEASARGALPEQIAKIAELTARNYDLAESSKEAGKSAEDAARDAEERWRQTHDYLSGAFVDIMENGGNAFDNIAKAFEKTVQRMVAQWAASGLMGMFSGNGLSGFTTEALIGDLGKGLFGKSGQSGMPGGLAGTVGIGAKIAGAASSAGSAIMGGLSAIPGWGWALGGAALIASQLDKSTPSGNAGFLIREPAGGGDGRTFDVPAFASGFDPVGFARREDQAGAVAVIDTFRQYDAALTSIAEAAGLRVNYNSNNFGGFSEKGQGGGLFFGSANEDGRNTAVPIEQQLTQFVGQWIKGLGGQVDQSLINDVLGAGSADAMIARAASLAGIDGSHATGLDRVPFDGYIAQLHKGERVLTADEARAQDSGMSDIMGLEMLKLARLSYGIIQDWNYRGLPATRAAA